MANSYASFLPAMSYAPQYAQAFADPWEQPELSRDALNAIVANRAGLDPNLARNWSAPAQRNPGHDLGRDLTPPPPGTRIRPQQNGVEVEEPEVVDLGQAPAGRADKQGGWNPWTGQLDRPQQVAVDPRKSIPQARAIQAEEARRANQREAGAAAVPRNPWDVFGTGGGDWASAWGRAQQKPQGIASALVGNQLNSFLNYGETLGNQFNSPVGPYGQLQHALTQQRPYKAQENVAAIEADAAKSIADTKAKTAMGLAGFLNGGLRSSPTAISTDYGASVTPEYRPFRAYRR